MNRMGRRYGFCSQDASEDEVDFLALQDINPREGGITTSLEYMLWAQPMA
jgi:hypothetical protein